MSRFRPRAIVASLFAAAVLGAVAFLVVPANAATGTPVSGDARAVAYAGNATTCAEAGLPGDIVQVGFTIDATGTFIDITSVPDGVALTGVVVKGGPAYNVYLGDVRTGLHAPLVSSGKPAQVSHWFACGTTVTESPTPTPTY